jgi:amidohydrolase
MSAPNRVLSDADVQELVEIRRDLHAHPEVAFEETRTAAFVAERLRALGLEPRTGVGRTGVVATIVGAHPGRTVLLRADMDALPVQEENDVPYRSRIDGRMHACGHDCHVAGLLGVARQLVRQAPSLPGAVKLCFQPAEEQGGGALGMVADGVLRDPRVDAAFGVHVWQDLEVGKVGVTRGGWMASVDDFAVTVTGRGAHAAAPHQGIDPVVALAHIITALQTIASRTTDPLLEVVVSVTQVRAGTAFNIIPESAWMNGTVRTFDTTLWRELPGRVERIVHGVAGALGCTAEVIYTRHNQPTVNDPAMADLASEAAAEVVGRDNVVHHIRTMGGEDFSVFLREVPGALLAVGSRNEQLGLTQMHHHPRFDVDEGCIAIGAEVLLRVARRFLEA